MHRRLGAEPATRTVRAGPRVLQLQQYVTADILRSVTYCSIEDDILFWLFEFLSVRMLVLKA
jgi:hypothetical protein